MAKICRWVGSGLFGYLRLSFVIDAPVKDEWCIARIVVGVALLSGGGQRQRRDDQCSQNRDGDATRRHIPIVFAAVTAGDDTRKKTTQEPQRALAVIVFMALTHARTNLMLK